MEGGKNTGMCQQLPGAKIVKALHGKRTNAQRKPHSFLHLLVDSLKVYWGRKIKKKPSLHLALGRSCKTEPSKDQLVVTVTEVAELGMFGYRKSFVHIDLNFCPTQTGCLHVASPSPSASFIAYPLFPLPPLTSTLLIPFPFIMEQHEFWIQISMLEKKGENVIPHTTKA